MIVNHKDNNNSKPDIIDWKASELANLSELRAKQRKLSKYGFHLENGMTTHEKACANCGCKQCVLTYTLDTPTCEIEFCFEMCPSCWQARELIPVYDPTSALKINDSDLVSVLSVLPDEQFNLVLMLLDIWSE